MSLHALDPNVLYAHTYRTDPFSLGLHESETSELPELYPISGDCLGSTIDDAATVMKFPLVDPFDFSFTASMTPPKPYVEDEDSQAGIATEEQKENLPAAVPQGTLRSNQQTMAIVTKRKRKAEVRESTPASASEGAESSCSEVGERETKKPRVRDPPRYAWEPQAHERTQTPKALQDRMCRVGGCKRTFNSLNSCYTHRDKHFESVYRCPNPGCANLYSTPSTFKRHLRLTAACDAVALPMRREDWAPYIPDRKNTWFKPGAITGNPCR
ncbi:hypothetical protein EVG20_g6950 [Dentipellis fragilis]|uniref:C2H2-type domain-containing protein n=1 Tax=Dentipellis fragilis TaxID=205917 RepID=A0A4Y9YH88_9AGAM|nr:hypothetical protein EVG20_g6950 [Dentipellis fragilis]